MISAYSPEAENTLLREQLTLWQEQARQALTARTNQQTLSLPGAMRDMPALMNGSDQAAQPVKKKRRFLWW